MNLYKKCTVKPYSFLVIFTFYAAYYRKNVKTNSFYLDYRGMKSLNYLNITFCMNLYKKCTVKPYSFLVIDTAFTSDKSLRFMQNLLERM